MRGPARGCSSPGPYSPEGARLPASAHRRRRGLGAVPRCAAGCSAFSTYALSVRWLVDGMNVIGTRPDAWWKDRHRAMVRLVDLLERWAASDGEEVTVVFERPPSPPIRSTVIEVAHAPRPRPDAADDEIIRR